MDRLPLRECARRCEISLDTAFKWRHRLLDSLQKIHGAVRLAGVVEVDEVYFSISYKGSKKFPAQRQAENRKNEGRVQQKEACLRKRFASPQP